MKPYNNQESSVSQYEIGDGYIDIKFNGGKTYRYTRGTCGEVHLLNMMLLADSQDGLNSYINIHHPGFVGQQKPIPEPQLNMLFAQKKATTITENRKEKNRLG